ncbi:MAG: hypothetical protein AB8G22_05025 [Saprospiraceae bacterium]
MKWSFLIVLLHTAFFSFGQRYVGANIGLQVYTQEQNYQDVAIERSIFLFSTDTTYRVSRRDPLETTGFTYGLSAR